MKKPEKKERCKCYDNGNKPALLTDFHSGSNICASCRKPMSSELKIYNQAIDDYEAWLPDESELAKMINLWFRFQNRFTFWINCQN